MDYKKAQKIALHGAIAGVALMLAGYIISVLVNYEPAICWILCIIGIPITFVSISIGQKYYKCPYCNGKLSLKSNPRFCPHCGKRLEEGLE